MRKMSAFLMLAALGGCGSTIDRFRARESYRALGNNPGWLVTIAAQKLTFVSSGRTLIEGPRPLPQATPTGRRYLAQGLTVDIVNRPCNDDRSGLAFADTVTVAIGSTSYRGCGGERVPLLNT